VIGLSGVVDHLLDQQMDVEYEIQTLTKLDNEAFDGKDTKGKVTTIFVDQKTKVSRDKKSVPITEPKVDQSVDAYVDGVQERPGQNIPSFNIGVEIGQVLALTSVLVAISYWRRHPGFLRHSFAANTVLMSGGIMLVGYQLARYLRQYAVNS
jgi:hypothetical protein